LALRTHEPLEWRLDVGEPQPELAGSAKGGRSVETVVMGVLLAAFVAAVI
jgi:hypothetical protein